jgi:hypothetical protein
MDVTGFWTGSYWYYEHGQPSVPFLANLDEQGGRLSGSISEPDLHFQTGNRLEAMVVGEREGMRVAFAKAYDGAGPFAHRVDYTGSLSDDGRTIRGSWYLSGTWGAFEMSRELLELEEPAEDRIEVPILLEADSK